jgi:glucuronoarabinoxylan endo-1,4-beta-xylanase
MSAVRELAAVGLAATTVAAACAPPGSETTADAEVEVAFLQSATVTVSWNDTRQTIDGFGVSQTGNHIPGHLDIAAYLQSWPEPQRSQMLDLAYSQAGGIGLTIHRSSILPTLSPSQGVWNYSDPAQTWIMKEATKRGPVKLIGTVWSPPAWMKQDGHTSSGHCRLTNSHCFGNHECGCTASPPTNEACGDLVCDPGTSVLRFAHYQSFADYLARYVKQYATANQVSIYAVSMANEPDASVNWDSCAWHSDWIATFLKLYLAPTFAANNIQAKVIAPEASSWDVVERYAPIDPLFQPPPPPSCQPAHPETCPPGAVEPLPLLAATYNDPAALARLDIAAGHLYDGDPTRKFDQALAAGKKVWQTEASLSHCAWDIDGALAWATKIHQGLTAANVSAWLWWNLFLWADNQSLIANTIGVGPAVCSDPASVGTHDGRNYSVSKVLWALGNYSRFIRPGFVRMHTSSSHSSLLASSYRDPVTGRAVVVVINHATSAIAASFSIPASSGLVIPYVTSSIANLAPQTPVYLGGPITIPARSIVTLAPPQPTIVWRGTDNSVNVWLMTDGNVQGRLWTGAPDAGWAIEGVGDFDNDAISDLLWRCVAASCIDTAHGQLAIWHRGQSTNPAPAYPGIIHDDGWRIQRIGDFNGDRRSDILWRYLGAVNHGQLAIWYSGQNANPPPAYPGIVPDDGWQIEGVGDFDANGRSDILWRYVGPGSGHGQLAIWWNGQATAPVPAYPGLVSDDSWRIKGIGDFNGDLRSDILWQKTGGVDNGLVAIWWNGQSTAWYPASEPNSNWVVKGVEDFDRDNRSDILWQYVGPSGATPHGQLRIWFAGQTASPPPAYPAIVGDNLIFQATGRSGL